MEQYIRTHHLDVFKNMSIAEVREIFTLINKNDNFFIDYGKLNGITINIKAWTTKVRILPNQKWQRIIFSWSNSVTTQLKDNKSPPNYEMQQYIGPYSDIGITANK